jgi:uncharacterized protein GlcG (DUF336 family)
MDSWTKGGREREIPISTPEQRALLDAAKALAGGGSLIPKKLTYVEQLNRFKDQCATPPAEGNSRSRLIDRDCARDSTITTHTRSTRNRYQVESPMANVVKKNSISSELAQKMVDQAVAKARKIGVAENVAILDDGGNLKAFSRMDGAPILSIEIAQNKAYTALFGVSTQDFFNFIQGDPSLLAGIPTLARVAAYGGGFPIKVDGEIVGAIGVSGAPTVQNDVDCARAALALVPDAVPAE